MRESKKIVVLIIIFMAVIYSLYFVIAETLGESQTSSGTTQTSSNQGTTVTEIADTSALEGVTVEAATEATSDTPATPETYDLSKTTADLSVTEVPSDVAITTTQGTIADFSMTNALFSLGSLIQGSFVSFSKNNNIFFGSLFDASSFVATLDEKGSIDVGQRNSFGDTGKIYISIEGGNLTQDNNLVFVPEGNNPTYIYYNTTEIEIKDGNLSLLGETVTNNDNSEQSSKVNFDSEGFTKIQLLSENSYTNEDIQILNTGREDLYICKKDPLCDINIDEATFTLKGKSNFSYKGEPLYISEEENNIFTLHIDSGEASLKNSKGAASAVLFSGYHEIKETAEHSYGRISDKEYPYIITSYTNPNNQTLKIQFGNLETTSLIIYKPGAP